MERDKKNGEVKNKERHQKTRIFETITELFACRSSARMSQLQQNSATSLGSGDIAYDATPTVITAPRQTFKRVRLISLMVRLALLFPKCRISISTQMFYLAGRANRRQLSIRVVI